MSSLRERHWVRLGWATGRTVDSQSLGKRGGNGQEGRVQEQQPGRESLLGERVV